MGGILGQWEGVREGRSVNRSAGERVGLLLALRLDPSSLPEQTGLLESGCLNWHQ